MGIKPSFLRQDNLQPQPEIETSIIPDSITSVSALSISTAPAASVSVRLRADEIYLDPVTDIRYGDLPPGDDGGIPELTSSMEWRQAEPLLVRPISCLRVHIGMGYRYAIINGRRRLAAMRHLPDFEFDCRCVLDCDDDTAYRLALSTFRRRDLTVIQLLHNIQETRKRKGWLGPSTAAATNGSSRENHYVPELARYFGFSEAKIREIERLGILPTADQTAIHEGRLSPEAAYLNAKVRQRDPELAERVTALAGELAAKEETAAVARKKRKTKRKEKNDDRGTRSNNTERVTRDQVNPERDPRGSTAESGASIDIDRAAEMDGEGINRNRGVTDDQKGKILDKTDPHFGEDEITRTTYDPSQSTQNHEDVPDVTADIEQVKISRKHMLKASRELAPDIITRERDRLELLDFFLELRITHYPLCMARFAEWFAEEFAGGLPGSDRHLTDLWDGISQEIRRLEAKIGDLLSGDGGDCGGGD